MMTAIVSWRTHCQGYPPEGRWQVDVGESYRLRDILAADARECLPLEVLPESAPAADIIAHVFRRWPKVDHVVIECHRPDPEPGHGRQAGAFGASVLRPGRRR